MLASTASPTPGSSTSYFSVAIALCGAIAYPFLLKAFHAGTSSGAGGMPFLGWLLLLLAIAVPVAGIEAATRLGQLTVPSRRDLLAKRLALLTIAAAPIFTASGVLLHMAGGPINDIIFWLLFWGGAIALLLARWGDTATTSPVPFAKVPQLRVAHGIGALAIVLLFLAMHLTNHLFGLAGEAMHRHYMEMFESVYRARWIEPAVVLLFLFLVITGINLFWQHTKRPADVFRTLQIASGIYLVFFVLAHMNSVFFYARTFANIPTDWNFAIGAPAGLLHDAWNIRLVPHYLLGVFFVLLHLVIGARGVALAHGLQEARANRLTWLGMLLSGAISVAIILGMTGVRVV